MNIEKTCPSCNGYGLEPRCPICNQAKQSMLMRNLNAYKPQPLTEPNCNRSACGDFSPGACDNDDCPALERQEP